MEFNLDQLNQELNRRRGEALDYVHSLESAEILNCDPACASEIVRQFLVNPPVLGEFYVEEDVFEMSDAMSSRKTGMSGMYAFIPYEGEKSWLYNIRNQEVDGYPLAFAEERRIKIVVVFDPTQDDAQSLSETVSRQRDLVSEYVDLALERISEFNQELAREITSAITQRRETLWKTYSALNATGLPTEATGVRERREEERREILQKLNSALSGDSEDKPLRATRIFLVHGHDEKTKYEVKNYIQNTLGLGEPVILHEQPSSGRTIIEKFEHFANETDLVFILLTPDDEMADSGDADDKKKRARQNVIFEMGCFLGILKRQTGRVILLYKGNLDLPSDISGLIYINITKGIDAAGEEIRRELKALRVLA